MEPFSLSELGLPMENKAIQGVLCPMAVELCHLLLALEREDGICEAFPNLGEKAEKLAKATEKLSAVARRLSKESSDKVTKEEMHPVAESLTQAGKDVLLAAHQLQGYPDSPRLREDLAAAAQRVLMETAQILQLVAAAGTRRITEAANWLLECMRVLRDARDMPGLLAAFQAFSQAVLLLSQLTAECLQELGDCPRRESLVRALQHLHTYVPLLHASKHSSLQHSRDWQADLSKDNTFQLMEGTIQELTSLLMDNTGKEPQDRDGTFSQEVSKLLALLSHPDSLCLSQGGFSSHLEAVVLHGMLLADSSRLDLKLELVEHCWVLLQLRKSIWSCVSKLEGQPGQIQGVRLEQECHSMREELENLDQAVLRATLCQILDSFLDEKEPLKQLVEGALSLACSGCFPAGPGGILRKLQPLTATFFTQAQQMLRATHLVLARCSKPQTAREIREWVEHLQNLLASLPALLMETSRNAMEQLQGLCRAWARATNSLVCCFEEIVSIQEFLEMSLLEMGKHREWCEAALGSQDPDGLSWHATHLTSWARWVVGATTRYVDRSTDPIFRNGLLVWVEQLTNSYLELRAVTALCPERLSCLQIQDSFSQAANCLMDTALCVQSGLDGSNHPDILSPLREHVRSTEATKGLKLSPGLQTVRDEAGLQGDILNHPCSSPGNLHQDIPQKRDPHPVITALLAASQSQDTAAVSSTCSALLELSDSCVDAVREALPMAEPSQLQVLGKHQDIMALTPQLITLAKDTALRQVHAPGRLLQLALRLSGRIQETQECLAAVAGAWYSFSQQVFGFILSGDFPRGKQALDETLTGLAGAVQLAGDIASAARRKGNLTSPKVWESFLQVQAKFSRAQLNTRVFLEKAASFRGSCTVEKASLELHSVWWAVGMCVLLHAMDQFVGRDVLFLRELSSAVRNKLGSPSLLAAVAENSLRLQEAAQLSYLSCPGGAGGNEILVLREEIQVLMEALLDATNTLLVSPLPTASLSIRFELLQRDVALRSKILLLHLEGVNTKQLQLIRDVVGPALSNLTQEERETRKEAFEEKASGLMADVQWVTNTLKDALKVSAQLQSQANLLSVAEHLLVLTSDVVGSAQQHFQSHQDTRNPCQDTEDPCQDTGDLHLDTMIWYWSAKAHYLLTQLRTVYGISRDVLQRIVECLQRDQGFPGQSSSTSQLCPAPESTESAGTHPGRSRGASRAMQEHQDGPSSISPGNYETHCDTLQGGPSKVSQVTQDMAVRMVHMTQFLRKKGPILSKEQFVACARQMAFDGQVVVKFGHILAKQCLDQRCSMELLRAAEHTHTISSQLSIVARVKAVTGESKASSELLLSNAQNLVRAVWQVLRAAEAACVKGLGQPSADPEEQEVAAFCLQWRKNLLWHRAKEALISDRDELGLRRTRGAKAEPTLMALVQEAPESRNIPKHPNPRKGHTAMHRHL